MVSLSALHRYPGSSSRICRGGHTPLGVTAVYPLRSLRRSPSSISPHPPKNNLQGSSRFVTTHAVAVPAAKTVTGFWPLLVQAYMADPAGLLLGVGACVAGIGVLILFIAALPALFALKRCIQAVESLVHELKHEVSDTAAALRLSGLEIADAVEEVSALGSDLTQGVRASARALVSVEQGMREGVSLAEQAVTSYMVPGLKKVIPETRGLFLFVCFCFLRSLLRGLILVMHTV